MLFLIVSTVICIWRLIDYIFCKIFNGEFNVVTFLSIILYMVTVVLNLWYISKDIQNVDSVFLNMITII
jgi:hypothetical protein